MSENNLAIWDRLGKTAPEHTKKFARAGGFKGTAIKPIYTEHKMTQEFGPCGVGWGIEAPTFTTVPGSDGQVAVYCSVAIWVNVEGKVSAPIYGVGGDMVVVKQTDKLRTDDEAFKKAFTDAIGNAMKHLGMSADVHMGLFDDSKYVDERRAEEKANEPEADKPRWSKADPDKRGRNLFDRLTKALREINSSSGVENWALDPRVDEALKTLPVDWEQTLRTEIVDRFQELMKAEAPVAAEPADVFPGDKPL